MARGDDRRDPLVIFRAPPEWKARLYAHAEAQGISVSDVARAAIDAALPDDPGNTAKAASTPQVAPPKPTGRGSRAGIPNQRCKHRVPSGSFCRRCNSGDRT